MIVFPMAGLSSRFMKAGYTLPKYMLDLGGRSLFQHTVGGFRKYFDSEIFVFVYRDIAGTRCFLERQLLELGLPEDRCCFVSLDAPTSGQAETVAVACRSLPHLLQEQLIIFNIDTIRPRFELPSFVTANDCDGYLEVFLGDGSHWSFVDPIPSSNFARRVTEKLRVSNLCSTGLYHFKQGYNFLRAYETTEKTDPSSLQGGERYVAPLYNVLIAEGQSIRYNTIEPNEVLFSGTPDEYELLVKRQQQGTLS